MIAFADVSAVNAEIDQIRATNSPFSTGEDWLIRVSENNRNRVALTIVAESRQIVSRATARSAEK